MRSSVSLEHRLLSCPHSSLSLSKWCAVLNARKARKSSVIFSYLLVDIVERFSMFACSDKHT